ncbi:hypothetical protein ABZ412_34135 [Nocardia sp. NPDC005746]|uniref:hypothetical protein n=1 Tax=Nocardia sp. NPDC005746 TaxID=3157062 RepID=UPI0033FDDDB3
MTTDQITAIGAIVTTLIGAVTTWQVKKVAELQARVDKVEGELAESKGLFREAVKFIRILMAHIAELTHAHRLGTPAPQTPEIPERLREEV